MSPASFTTLRRHAFIALPTLVWALASLVVCLIPTHLHNSTFINHSLDSRTSHRSSNQPVSSHKISHKSLLEAAKHLQSSRNATKQPNNPANSLINTRQRWRQMEAAIGARMVALSQTLRSTLDGLATQSPGSLQLSTECRSALDELLDGLQQQSSWATQMIDASARLPSGLMSGTLTELGNFDQCLGLSHQSSDNRLPIRGQYCTIQVKPPLTQRARLHTICQRLPPLSSSQIPNANQSSKMFKILADQSQHFYYAGLRLGVCAPSKCSKSDLQFLLSNYVSRFDLFGQVKSCQVSSDSLGSPSESDEDVSQTIRLDAAQQCIAATFAFLFLMVLAGTAADYATSAPRSRQNNIRFPATASNTSSDSLYTSFAGKGRDGPNGLRVVNQPSGPGARRWLYQVYRPPRTTCPLHQQQLDKCRPLNSQRNPLADQSSPSATLQSCSHLLFKEPSELTEEASWLVDMDHSQVMSPTSLLGSSTAPTFIRQASHLQQDPRVLMALAQKNASMNEKNNSQTWSSIMRRFIVCFSLRSNLKVILGFSSIPSGFHQSQHVASNLQELGGDIRVVHGLRTVTMAWIIFGHSIGLVNPEMMNNLFSIAQYSCTSRLLQTLLNATLAVNTFFMLSGLVTVISLARKCPSVCNQFMPERRIKPIVSRVSDCKSAGKSFARSKSRHTKQANKRAPRDKQDRRRNDRRKHRAPSTLNQPLDLSSSAADSSASSTTSSIASSLLSSSASSNRCIGPTANQRTNAESVWPPADFKPLVWLLLRYLRLTPAYAAVLGASVLLPALGAGPFWQESAGSLGVNCRENWWLNLLYVNNFVNTDKLCLIHSWYLSNDWQFFALTLIFLAIFYKSRRVALLLLITSMIASSAANFAITVANDFPPTIVTTSPAIAERWLFIHSLYYKPWPHLPAYLVGVITGYLMLRRQQTSRNQMSRWTGRIAWLLFSLLALALLNSIYPWNMGLQVDPMLAGLHSATFRTLWAVCCAWLVYSLSSSPKNWLAKLLGWHGFHVSSRLTYCLYLVHPLVIYYHFGTLRERLDSSPYGQFHRFIATLGLSYLAALVLTLLVEGPALKLLRLLGGVLGVSQEQNGSHAPKNSTSCYSSSSLDNSWSGSFAGDQQTYGLGPGTNKVETNVQYASQQNQNAFVDPNQKQKQGAVASLDADFQRRLAQAISRGFRVRSRLANGPVNPTSTTGATSRRATPVNKWPAAVPPPPPPLMEQPSRQLADKTRKKVEFSTFVTPNVGCASTSEHSSRSTFSPEIANQSHNIQQRRRSHQDLMMGAGELKQQPAPNLASLNHQILAQHQKLVSRSNNQL